LPVQSVEQVASDLVKRQAETARRLEQLLLDARKQAWWLEVVRLMRERRQIHMEELAAGVHDQRAEDRLRGRIDECGFVLALNEVQIIDRGGDHASERE